MLQNMCIQLSFDRLRASLKLIAVLAATSNDGAFSPAH